MYCSDVAGAFDRVWVERLVEKLKKKGLNAKVVALMAAWLKDRVAHVVVEGTKSAPMVLKDMVYQGTV